MNTDINFDQAASCLRILAHPARLQLVHHLLSDRSTVGELAELCGLKPHVASEHLRRLELCGLLVKKKDGRRTYYESGHACLKQMMGCIEQRFSIDQKGLSTI